MKKLTKMGIDALRETLPVLSREEQSSCMGMYSGDCFWRCVAFLSSGDFSEAGAAAYALDYFVEELGGTNAAYNRLQVTAWIGAGEASGYLSQNGHLRVPGMSIACVNPYAFSDYTGHSGHLHQTPDGTTLNSCGNHYVVVFNSQDSDGSRLAFDPTTNRQFRISSGEYGLHVQNYLV